ncbi:glucohydrolase [Actinomyces radicidentis]|uniref:Glucohydrolase n=1 Tax=Actinomyces radicidentis TaxID=111015 RepID=A0A0X8JD76_ACTRD|nr:alpha-glucosidase [Actinomyces radicidentis]AMD86429.1 glucohydrolase [Actinomyces radicidentis]
MTTTPVNPPAPFIVSPRHAGEDPEWWRRAVVYQVYPRSFQDTDGDGLGDIRGITSRLDHLDSLGVDVVWLSPVYRSPQDDNGYDIADYEDIDPMFGSLADLDELIAGLHSRGMRLVMDLVVNHTSDEHAWFTESRASKDGPKRDWYIWRPAREIEGLEPGAPGTEPTNWGSAFSGSAWEWDEGSGEFFLHLFSRKQPDLNWENPEVRQAVYAFMNRWVDRGVDGFRMDVINLISKTYPLSDGPQGEGDLYGSGFAAVANGPRVHEFLHEMNEAVFASRSAQHVITVGETPGVTRDEAALFTDPARAEVDMVFQFEHVGLTDGPGGKFDPVPLDRVALKRNLADWQAALAPVTDGSGAVTGEEGWNSLYWDNHDQPRAVSRFGDDDPAWRERSAKTLASVLHLHRGTPYVYQGEELGQTNTVFGSIDDFRDLESVNHFHERVGVGDDPAAVLDGLRPNSRDNARTPVQWDASENAGFTTGTPWIDVAPGAAEVNAAAQVGVPGSVFEHYRALIDLRHSDDALALGTFRLLDADDAASWTILREHVAADGAREQLLLVASCSREDLETGEGSALRGRLAADGLDLADWDGAERVLVASLPADEAVASGTGVPERLGGWDSVLLRRSL